jgi:glutamate-1-semialdehyde 2,1-aminomutase
VKLKKYTKLLNKYIPGGAHTYSRGYDQFSENAPEVLLKGDKQFVYDVYGNKFLDFGMGLRSIGIGYNEKKINDGAFRQIKFGNNLTRPSLVELEAAKKFVNHFDSVDMVKFTKNGSTAVTAAVKLSRGFNQKKIVARCVDHPFFSYDDWFIGSTIIKRGVPKEISDLTVMFKYNDIESLKKIILQNKNNISCVVLEPSTICCPLTNNLSLKNKCCGLADCTNNFKSNFLLDVQNICKENKIIFILDEMITGFRWNLYGAQNMYGVDPDISTFGKAMANGFPLAAIGGKEEIMSIGGINKKNSERLFLLSTTHGAEMSSLGAFIENLNFYKKKDVIKNIWKTGYELKKIFNDLSKEYDLSDYVKMAGIACSPFYICKDQNKKISNSFKTLFMQEMIKNKILWPSFVSVCYRHNQSDLQKVKSALKKVLPIYKAALKKGIKKYLKGNSIQPVFRRYN